MDWFSTSPVVPWKVYIDKNAGKSTSTNAVVEVLGFWLLALPLRMNKRNNPIARHSNLLVSWASALCEP